jgi:UDP-glucose 4-epimerase
LVPSPSLVAQALDYLDKVACGWHTHNLGTGTGYSVLQMVQAMEKASGRKVAYT